MYIECPVKGLIPGCSSLITIPLDSFSVFQNTWHYIKVNVKLEFFSIASIDHISIYVVPDIFASVWEALILWYLSFIFFHDLLSLLSHIQTDLLLALQYVSHLWLHSNILSKSLCSNSQSSSFSLFLVI